MESPGAAVQRPQSVGEGAPVIARATGEGLRSLPHDIREGSHAVGATDGHALLHILLPWAIPNIITGLLLGMAEAAGSVTVLLFISGNGQYGIGARHEATSLAYLIFASGRPKRSETALMRLPGRGGRLRHEGTLLHAFIAEVG